MCFSYFLQQKSMGNSGKTLGPLNERIFQGRTYRSGPLGIKLGQLTSFSFKGCQLQFLFATSTAVFGVLELFLWFLRNMSIYIYICICTHVYMSVYIYIYICMHMHISQLLSPVPECFSSNFRAFRPTNLAPQVSYRCIMHGNCEVGVLVSWIGWVGWSCAETASVSWHFCRDHATFLLPKKSRRLFRSQSLLFVGKGAPEVMGFGDFSKNGTNFVWHVHPMLCYVFFFTSTGPLLVAIFPPFFLLGNSFHPQNLWMEVLWVHGGSISEAENHGNRILHHKGLDHHL